MGTAQGQQPAPDAAPLTLRVLLVEDNPGDASLVRIRLEDLDHFAVTLVTVDTVGKALEQLHESHDYDLVLLDLSLPDAVRLDALFRLRELQVLPPVVVLSGSDDEELAAQALRGGAQDYIRKQHLDDLERTIRYAIERSTFQERLRQAEKMEAIGALAGGIAHDFNNLLGVILGYTDVLLGDAAMASGHEALEQIREAGERARDLTQQILTFGRRHVSTVADLVPDDLVLSTASMLKRLIGENIELVVETRAPHARLRGDRSQFEQILLNLVINARDAILEMGTVTVGTQMTVIDARTAQKQSGACPGTHLDLWVKDTGSGMDEALVSRIFDPFFTTKRPNRGTGLGLSTVQSIVRQWGGFIDVSSTPRLGTTFHIYLPCTVESTAPRAVPAARPAPAPGRERILILEDLLPLRRLISKVLREEGYATLEAEDGDQGLELIQREPVDMLVADVVVPRRSGREVAEEAVRLNPGLRVLFLSGYGRDALSETSIPEEQRGFISKPFKPQELLSAVRDLLERREPQAEPARRRRALVIEDAAAARAMVSALLAPLQFDCVECRDALDAISQLSNREFDLITLDLDLPGDLQGTQLLEFVRTFVGQVPIVVLAGDDSPALQARLVEQGANACISKKQVSRLQDEVRSLFGLS